MKPAVLALTLLSPLAFSDAAPRYVADLGRAGFLAEATGEPPELTAVAGARFVDLVPESRKEVCRLILEHHALSKRGVYRLRVVDERGRELMACDL